MNLPTYERRFYLGLLTKDAREREEKLEEQKAQAKTTNGKGTRQTRVSGSALKSKLQSGEVK